MTASRNCGRAVPGGRYLAFGLKGFYSAGSELEHARTHWPLGRGWHPSVDRSQTAMSNVYVTHQETSTGVKRVASGETFDGQ